MIRYFPVVSVVIATGALAAASPQAAAPAPTQRIMLIQTQRFESGIGRFEFRVLSEGRLRSDTGSYTLVSVERPYVVREGQRRAVYETVATLRGKRGTLELRWRTEFAGAGAGNTVGTGTWSVVRGTGMYAQTTGGGRLACVVYTPRGFTSSQFEGILRAGVRMAPVAT